MDQDKLIEKIKDKKIPGLPEGVIRVGVKNYFAANPRNVSDNRQPTSEAQPISIPDNEP